MIQHLLRDVKDLPALPAALTRLLQLVYEEADVREIARTITLDSALTARLLRVANSSFYGFRQEISTVHQATVLLGTAAVRNLALGVAMAGFRAHMPKDGPLGPESFWRHSIAVACGARHLARAAGCDPEEAFVAGLLHDIGKMIIARHDAAAYRAAVFTAATSGRVLCDVEREMFGYDHSDVGRALCDHWGIPDVLSDPVAAHHSVGATVPLPAVLVGAANEAALLAGLGDSGDPCVRLGRTVYATHRARLLGIIEGLADEVACLEGLFFDTDFDGFEPFVPHPERPRVRIEIADAERRTLVLLALTAIGYVVEDRAPLVLRADAGAARPADVPDAVAQSAARRASDDDEVVVGLAGYFVDGRLHVDGLRAHLRRIARAAPPSALSPVRL